FKYILDAKDGEMRDLEKTLESEMGILVKANKELNHYRLQDNLMMILNRFVHQNPYVNAAQWYHYGEKNYQGQTKFKMTFQYGEVTEGVTLNAVQQVYYQCSTSTLKKFRKAKRSYTEDSNPDQLVDFIIEVHNEITLKDKLTKEDAILCSLMLLSFEILEKDFGLVFEDLYGPNIGRFQEVIDNNRTGLLRAGLMEDEYYSFTHTRENEKFNRQYVARLVKVRDEDIVFTIVLDSSILEEEEYEQVMLSIATNFENLLKDLETMYNRGNERAGE